MAVTSSGEPNIYLESTTAIAGTQFNGGRAAYSTVRTASGWVTSPLALPASEYQMALPPGSIIPGALGASSDARSALWLARGDSQPENRLDLYVTRPGGAVEDVGPVTPPGGPSDSATGLAGRVGFELAGFSGDLSHVVFTLEPFRESNSGYDFWPFDETKKEVASRSLYELIGAGNSAPLLVGVDNTDKLISRCATELGGTKATHNAMSSDGSVLFFTADSCGASLPVNELFARIDNGQPDAHTVAISEPSAADCPLCDENPDALKPGDFESASEDGSKVFFTTTQPLLGGDESDNVYEYDFDAPAGEKLTRVSGGDSTVSDPAASVEGLVQSSEDGSHAYFVAQGVLTTTPNNRGQVAQAGANNLYVFERDASYPAGHTVFVADLSANDEVLWAKNGEPHPADLTPEGRFMVFTSATDHLTSDDTSTARQVFEYDAQSGALVRVSIGQNGFNDNGNRAASAGEGEEAKEMIRDAFGYKSTPFDPGDYTRSLTMSDDGSYVFFETSDGLTPQAVNRKVIGERNGHLVYAQNIYEYRDGSVYLISDGRDISTNHDSDSGVGLLGVSPSGADVFFDTTDPLAPQDFDSDMDIYDARVGGGFPAPVVTPECSSDGCQGPLAAAPTLLSPGSEFQAGVENAASPPLKSSTEKVKPKVKSKRKRRKGARKGRKARKTAAERGRGHGKAGRS